MKLNTPIIKDGSYEVYTMRHAESIGNAKGLDDESLARLANHSFVVTEKGFKQLSLSAEYMKSMDFLDGRFGVYTSGFSRAQESMGAILNILGKDNVFNVISDSRLDEWWRGIFHSLPKEIVEKNYSLERMVQEREGLHHYRAPQGQAGKDVEVNLVSFLRDVPEKQIFIVGHGRNLGFLRRILTNAPLDLNCKYPIPENGEIWKFSKDGSYYNFESLFVPKVDS